MTVTILLYNEFSSRNLGGKRMMLWFNVFLTLAILPQTCDDLQRQKKFVLKIFSFSPISV